MHLERLCLLPASRKYHGLLMRPICRRTNSPRIIAVTPM